MRDTVKIRVVAKPHDFFETTVEVGEDVWERLSETGKDSYIYNKVLSDHFENWNYYEEEEDD